MLNHKVCGSKSPPHILWIKIKKKIENVDENVKNLIYWLVYKARHERLYYLNNQQITPSLIHRKSVHQLLRVLLVEIQLNYYKLAAYRKLFHGSIIKIVLTNVWKRKCFDHSIKQLTALFPLEARARYNLILFSRCLRRKNFKRADNSNYHLRLIHIGFD